MENCLSDIYFSPLIILFRVFSYQRGSFPFSVYELVGEVGAIPELMEHLIFLKPVSSSDT